MLNEYSKDNFATITEGDYKLQQLSRPLCLVEDSESFLDVNSIMSKGTEG